MAYNFIDYLLGRTPTREDKERGYFGDTMSQFGNDELDAAKYLFQNAGTVAADSLPEWMGAYRNALSYPTDLVNAALLGAYGGGQKAVAGISEIFAGDQQSEKQLAKDILGGLEVAGVGPQSRALSLLTAPAKAAAAQRAPYLLSDAKYAARSIADADFDGVMEAFYGGGTPQSLSAASTKNNVSFEEAPMIVQHNISPEGLSIANQVGGLPMPSIGIAGANAPLENFGDITLLLSPEKIAPRRDLPVYPADAFTGRQPRAFMDFVDEDQVRKNFRADPRFEHIGSSWLDSYPLDDADYMMKVVERGIEEKLINPKNFDDFRKMYREAEAKLGADAYDAELMSNVKGLSQYGDMQLSIAPEDWYTPSGNRRNPKPYTVEEAYKRMNKKKAYEAGAEQHSGAGLLRAVLLDKFKSLDDIKANRGLLRPSGNEMQDIKGSWDTMSYDAINDIAEKYFDGSHRKAEDYVTDVAMGKSVSWANAPDGARKATEKTLAKLKKEVKGMPTEYFEAKPRSIAKIGDFNAAVVPEGRQSVIDVLKDAGVKDIRTYNDDVEGMRRADIIRQFRDLMFAAPFGGLLGYNALTQQQDQEQKGRVY